MIVNEFFGTTQYGDSRSFRRINLVQKRNENKTKEREKNYPHVPYIAISYHCVRKRQQYTISKTVSGNKLEVSTTQTTKGKNVMF